MSAAWRSSTVLAESASAWHVGGFLFWMLIVIGIVAILALVLVLATRGDDTSDAFTGAPEPDALAAARPVDELQAPED